MTRNQYAFGCAIISAVGTVWFVREECGRWVDEGREIGD